MVKPYFKPLDRPDREETWFCYYSPRRPSDQEEKSPRNAISQVPDLNMGIEPDDGSNLETEKPCRWRIKEFDSNYVKLAKSGGHKDLLQFKDKDTRSKEPKSYPVPVWYRFNEETVKAAREKEEQRKKDLESIRMRQDSWHNKLKNSQTSGGTWPDWLVHEPHKALESATRQPKRPIMGFDNLSAWKREEFEKKPLNFVRKSKSNMLARKGENSQSKTATGGKLKLPKSSKRQLPGDSKYTSSDYAMRWYDKWYVKAL